MECSARPCVIHVMVSLARTPMYTADYKYTPSPGFSPMTPGTVDYSPRTPGSPLETGTTLAGIIVCTGIHVYCMYM